MEDWIPWPDIDGGQGQQKAAHEVDLSGLGPQEVKMCRQLEEMGFPMVRLAKAAR